MSLIPSHLCVAWQVQRYISLLRDYHVFLIVVKHVLALAGEH